MTEFTWSNGRERKGYECSSQGDARFSALCAVMPDGRTIEMWYQCDVKGYDPGTKNWRLGKGKPPLAPYAEGELYQMYKALWRIWAMNNAELILQMVMLAAPHNNHLTDKFATSDVNQARALAEILNEWG